MFKFLKNIMNNEEVNLTNDSYLLHRILKKNLVLMKMKLYLVVVVSGALKNVFGNSQES